MSDVVLDSSAILCLLNGEPGTDVVSGVLPDAVISTVNWCEVFTKLVERGADVGSAKAVLDTIRLKIIPFDEKQALIAAGLRPATRSLGLSLGDRACLATALSRSATALTADRVWARLPALCGSIQLLR